MEKRHTLTDVKQTTKRKNRCCFFGRSWKENKKELKCYSQFTLVQITAAASANTLCARERAAVWGEAMSQWNAPNKQAFCHQFRTVPVQLCVSIFHTHIYMYRFELRSIGFTYVSVVPFWMLACSSWHWRACYKHNFSLSLSLYPSCCLEIGLSSELRGEKKECYVHVFSATHNALFWGHSSTYVELWRQQKQNSQLKNRIKYINQWKNQKRHCLHTVDEIREKSRARLLSQCFSTAQKNWF